MKFITKSYTELRELSDKQERNGRRLERFLILNFLQKKQDLPIDVLIRRIKDGDF